MKTITLGDFFKELDAQGVPEEHWAFVCPMCKTVQSPTSLARAMGVALGEGKVSSYLAFSCIGRFTDAGPYHAGDPPGKGCDWTLGGLLPIHELEVIDDEGQHRKQFAPASPEQAKALMTEQAVLEPRA